ncbi:CRP/FNR family transcriptional regulator [Desulfitispora alkaliphila]|uniref:Crp/Fnr family transcriptional regulator n=1 Tax=Desulfitispora alkaliphila TaxID=622674 RepID=UPI003D229A46
MLEISSDAVQSLKAVPFFSDLSHEDLKRINDIVIYRRYRKGMLIFMEGEPGDELYFVKEGRIKLSKMLDDGREHILHFVQAGEVFAEILLFDGGNFPATAEVMEKAEIGIIRNKDLDKLLKECPEITLKLLKVMSKRLRKAQLQIRDLALKDTYSRLASTLLKLAQEYGDDSGGINFTLSQQELANMIGSSRETVARILSDFKNDNLISVQRKRIIILDSEGLKNWSVR